MLATANTGKTWERSRKYAGEWTERVEISKEEIPGSTHRTEGRQKGRMNEAGMTREGHHTRAKHGPSDRKPTSDSSLTFMSRYV